MTKSYKSTDLDIFVKLVDDVGGPTTEKAQSILSDFSVIYSTEVNVDLDPYSEIYVSQQLKLYEELSNKDTYKLQNEVIKFDIEAHSSASNPYGIKDPSNFVYHYLRIGEAVQKAQLPVSPRVLDMGVGWGLSSEFLATLGAQVTAIDINPLFVDLVNRRSSRLALPIKAYTSSFEDIDVSGVFDFVYFYECLHHSIRPWDVINQCAAHLNAGGKIGFSGEPIQENWWPHWGLRLDALSVYCIRKFGWFESGWSRHFLIDMFVRAGLRLQFYDYENVTIGSVGIASFDINTVEIEELKRNWLKDGWSFGSNMAIASQNSTIALDQVPKNRSVSLRIHNYRGAPVNIIIRSTSGRELLRKTLDLGISYVSLEADKVVDTIVIHGEVWRPDIELGNGDTRIMSFQMDQITFAS